MSWNRGHSIAILLASRSLGIRSVTETPDAILVEYGQGPQPPKKLPERCADRPHKKWPIRR